MKKIAVFSIFLVVFFSGCIKKDDFEFDNPDFSSWNPDVALPLVNASLSMDDILGRADSGLLEVDPATDRIILIYESNVYSLVGADFLPLLQQVDFDNFQLTPFDSTQLALNGNLIQQLQRDFLFNVANGELLDSIILKSGNLDIALTNSAPHGGVFEIKIPGAKKNGVVFEKSIPFNSANGTPEIITESFDLSGYSIDFTSGTGSNRIFIRYESAWTNSGSPERWTNSPLNFVCNYRSLKLSAAFGDFGQRSLSLSVDSNELSVFQNTLGGSIRLDQPKLIFNIRNGFGMPIRAELRNLSALPMTGSPMPITGAIPNPLPVGVPGAPGLTASTSFFLDYNNSNIETVLNSSPKYINYEIEAVSNIPGGSRNFLLDTSRFTVGMRMELPLVGYASGLTVQDTADFNIDSVQELESAMFRLYLSNSFPAQSRTQIYFTDSLYQILDSLILNPSDGFIPSGILDAQGIVIAPTEKTHDEFYDRGHLENIFRATKLLIKGEIDTRNAPLQSVEIHSNNRLTVKIGVRAKLNVDFQ